MERVWRITLFFLIFSSVFDPLMTFWGIGRLGAHSEGNETIRMLIAQYGFPTGLILHALSILIITLGICLLARFLFAKALGDRVAVRLGSLLAFQIGALRILAGLTWLWGIDKSTTSFVEMVLFPLFYLWKSLAALMITLYIVTLLVFLQHARPADSSGE